VPHLDSITFGYNGEPTLNPHLYEFFKIARQAREHFEWKGKRPIITLFTNSSTLGYSKVREKIREFDLILAKLDTATQKNFLQTNRPHQDTPEMKKIIESLAKFKQELPQGHKLTLQTLIYDSYNDYPSNNNEENINQLAKAIKKIRPHEVQIYSLARIPAEYYVHAIEKIRKQEIKKKLEEVINDNSVKIQYF
jgi:wyosine [tRNA(Phe)-imidazoG37] synthetase (radical SAM superfamily)